MEQKFRFWLEGFLEGKRVLDADQITLIRRKLLELEPTEFVNIPFCNPIPNPKEELPSITTSQHWISGEGSLISFADYYK